MRTVSLVVGILALAALVLIIGRPRKTAVKPSDVSHRTLQPPADNGAAVSERVFHSRSGRAGPRTERVAALVTEIETANASEDDARRERVFQSVLASLVDLDPAAAAALLAKIGPGSFREEYLLRLAQLWAARDAKAALQWSSALENQDERASIQRSIFLEMAQTDPEGAILAMQNFGVPDDTGTLDSLAQLWASKDLSAAAAWALARPEGASRDSLVARVAYVMAERDPREAASLAVTGMTPGEVQIEAVISIVHRWASQDWNSARDWVDLFPEGPLRERAENELARITNYADALKQVSTGK